MKEAFVRTEQLLGTEGMKKLAGSRVAVFGLGGVGGYVAEALTRSGVGKLDLIDADTISESNLNRQILATVDRIGQLKTEAARQRIHSINPDCEVRVYSVFALPENMDQFDFSAWDYVVDAVDTVTTKLELAERAEKSGIPCISAMGTGNKLDPTKLVIADLYETSVCPLAKVMRHEARKRGIQHLKVVYSTEEPRINLRPPASSAFVPPAAGLIIASEVVKDLIADGHTAQYIP